MFANVAYRFLCTGVQINPCLIERGGDSQFMDKAFGANIYSAKSKEFTKKIQGFLLIIPIMIGMIAFLVIYGRYPLNCTKDNWILSGYDENDIMQHYSGWIAYRNSSWRFPLGMAEEMAVGSGTIISYTDSIPIVAILFKLIRNILPETFQYFGIYTLACYVLQSVAAFKITKMKTQSNIYAVMASVLFSFSPILMERAFRHTALGSQWLILFSIYVYLKYRDEKSLKKYAWYLLLEILAVGIHPYFLPMVAVFALLCTVYDVKGHQYIAAVYFVCVQGITCLFGVLIGALGSGSSISRSGYGYYSMNLNAIVNPVSCGQYTWSSLLKVHPQILGNYDGFNYLGFGILFLAINVLMTIFLLKKQSLLCQMVRNNAFLIAASVLLVCFAVSNVVTFNEKSFTIPLPPAFIRFCGIFRASSRMFYPVYYLFWIFLIILFWKMLEKDRKRYLYSVFLLVIVLQIFDIHGCIVEKHTAMNEKAGFSSYIENAELSQIAKNVDCILLDAYEGDIKLMAVYASKNHMSTYFSAANSGNYDETNRLSEEILTNIKEGGEIGTNLIVTTDQETADFYRQRNDVDIYEIGITNFIYRKQQPD